MFGNFNAIKTKVFLINDTRDCGADYGDLFSQFGEIVRDPAKFRLQPYSFRLMVFTGGADVSPKLYGDTSPENLCSSNPDRDREEKGLYALGYQRGIKMVGICRGMQFLNVMTGGKMVHHIDGHSTSSHQVMTRDRDEPFLVNSYHHQMCIPHKYTHILAWSHAKLSHRYIGDKDKPMNYKGPEVEAIYMPHAKAVGVQWHPEAAPEAGAWQIGKSWFLHLVRDLIDKQPSHFRKLYLGHNYEKLSVSEAL